MRDNVRNVVRDLNPLRSGNEGLGEDVSAHQFSVTVPQHHLVATSRFVKEGKVNTMGFTDMSELFRFCPFP